VIALASLVWAGRSDAAGAWSFVTVPEEQSGDIRAAALERRRGFGSVRAEVTVNDVTWRTSAFPLDSGG
jgi:hypothetical protein